MEYRRLLLRLASRDLTHHLGVDDVAAELADLAAGTLDAALAVARAKVGEAAHSCRLAVIAMGKCGGHELNYVSDVDVIFVAEPVEGVASSGDAAMRAATQLASTMMQVCSDHTGEGTIWPVDANLRPEGKSGPLVRSLASHRGYYDRWAKTWEFQALLKARPVAGDMALGREYVELIGPLVWSAAERDGFVEEVQAMRRRVIDHIPADTAERQLKLGSGGLRDVEFAVQLLQMVHGRADEEVRPPTTLSALARLTERGYVGREDGRSLHEAYSFLRTLEHRIQLYQLRRTHVVPEDEAALRRLGRSLGYTREPILELDKQWTYHRREVRRLHEKLFYRPLLSAVARIPGDGVGLSPEAAKVRLAALGYLDPKAALRHLEALTAGVSRTAQIQRTLLPAMLQWFADAPDPDAGLFGFRKISEALKETPWYLRLLRDEGEAAQRMAQVLATSRYATDLLQREPQGVALLGENERLEPLGREAVQAEMNAAAERREDAKEAVLADPRRTPPRAAPDQHRRPVRAVRGGRGGLRAHRRHQRRARRDPERGDPLGRGRQGRADADPDGDRRHGALRRVRARLRQRRRRDVRARPVAGRRPPPGLDDGQRGGQRRTPAADRARPRPCPGGRHQPASRGPAGTAGAHAGLLRGLLRQVVGGLGGAGAAARGTLSSATRGCARSSRR